MSTAADNEKARLDGRRPNQMRDVKIERNYLDVGEGSVLVSFGGTKVLCQASFTEGVPRWRKGSGLGWSRPNTQCCRARLTLVPAGSPCAEKLGAAPTKFPGSSAGRCAQLSIFRP